MATRKIRKNTRRRSRVNRRKTGGGWNPFSSKKKSPEDRNVLLLDATYNLDKGGIRKQIEKGATQEGIDKALVYTVYLISEIIPNKTWEYPDIVKILLEKGANKNGAQLHNKTALELAEEGKSNAEYMLDKIPNMNDDEIYEIFLEFRQYRHAPRLHRNTGNAKVDADNAAHRRSVVKNDEKWRLEMYDKIIEHFNEFEDKRKNLDAIRQPMMAAAAGGKKKRRTRRRKSRGRK